MTLTARELEIFDKTGMSTRLELALYAVGNGIVALGKRVSSPGPEATLLRTIQQDLQRLNTFIDVALGAAERGS